ncbi:MAG: hypothetical protein WB777_25955, partial [Mycobacterium sp.]
SLLLLKLLVKPSNLASESGEKRNKRCQQNQATTETWRQEEVTKGRQLRRPSISKGHLSSSNR